MASFAEMPQQRQQETRELLAYSMTEFMRAGLKDGTAARGKPGAPTKPKSFTDYSATSLGIGPSCYATRRSTLTPATGAENTSLSYWKTLKAKLRRQHPRITRVNAALWKLHARGPAGMDWSAHIAAPPPAAAIGGTRGAAQAQARARLNEIAAEQDKWGRKVLELEQQLITNKKERILYLQQTMSDVNTNAARLLELDEERAELVERRKQAGAEIAALKSRLTSLQRNQLASSRATAAASAAPAPAPASSSAAAASSSAAATAPATAPTAPLPSGSDSGATTEEEEEEEDGAETVSEEEEDGQQTDSGEDHDDDSDGSEA